jgi:hypothetical protein
LDHHIHAFLDYLDTLEGGFAPTTNTDVDAAADACHVAGPFIDALFTSARARGLIEPFQARGTRGRNRWRVSSRGKQWRSTAP